MGLSAEDQKLLDHAIAYATQEAEKYHRATADTIARLRQIQTEVREKIDDTYSQGVGVGLTYGALAATVVWGGAWVCFGR